MIKMMFQLKNIKMVLRLNNTTNNYKKIINENYFRISRSMFHKNKRLETTNLQLKGNKENRSNLELLSKN